MNDTLAKGLATFYSIAVVIILTWVACCCCCFTHHHCKRFRPGRQDNGANVEMSTRRSGFGSSTRNCQELANQPNPV